jgi:hypothetical protein
VLSPEVATAANRLVSPSQMHEDFRDRLDQLPQRTLEMTRYMEPETVGRQQLIGRFPAMTKAFAVGTLGGIDNDYLQLTTVIEGDRAAPNLAAASILAWDQSKRTDFDRTLEPVTPTAGLPRLIVDRLKTVKLEAEFNGVAMDEVFNYIGDETKVRFYLDGDALKDAGFTKVMRQTMHLGEVPAIDAVRDIVKRYEERDKQMALVIDEQAGVATITTAKAAERDGKTPYRFP